MYAVWSNSLQMSAFVLPPSSGRHREGPTRLTRRQKLPSTAGVEERIAGVEHH
jgi:hypothetical protein